MSNDLQDLKKELESDFWLFLQVILHQRYFGKLHEDICRFLTSDSGHLDRLVLVPRDHQKSVILAAYCVWRITKNPCIRIAYVTGKSGLAKKQIRFIKSLMTSKMYREIWPEMLPWKIEGGEWILDTHSKIKWTEDEMEVYHPLRRESSIPESTVSTSSVGSSKTGFHFDLLALDDLVDEKNYKSEIQRQEVNDTYAAFSSIASQGAETVAVGTRYHGDDLYGGVLMKESIEEYSNTGEFLKEEPAFDVFIRTVEDKGDMTGNYCWPRKQLENGDWFGWDLQTLARKKAKYKAGGRIDQFYAQYYNDPNAIVLQDRKRDIFKYFEPSLLKRNQQTWTYNNKRLRIFAAMDVAFSTKTRADYTAIVVVGVDHEGYYYVLDLVRFKTDAKMDDYYTAVENLYVKWRYSKLRVETNAGGKFVLTHLNQRFREEGISCTLDGKHQNKRDESKLERIESILLPHYDNGNVLHCPGGYIGLLEEELIMPKPAHDDLKDALAACFEICKKPLEQQQGQVIRPKFNKRFGGVLR